VYILYARWFGDYVESLQLTLHCNKKIMDRNLNMFNISEHKEYLSKVMPLANTMYCEDSSLLLVLALINNHGWQQEDEIVV